ncbi:Bug family tripartite tricarboxylate transporter substrate binding protein [Polynucleobacter sinensis]|jgi:tripartite-type tricarboxylate transporter receptor subunit TctC|uniref:Bug family tripartite tricarboxylate transporter substrate binding protein n=1 Tax=Polynucleobacter sinensis TaxID=1743157 RepID=UPI000783BA60|nr:tripartite tricarboxylate transporter substrate binding protein [Polynucleobacter sinensis]
MFLKFVFRVSATCLVLTLGSLQSLTVFAQPATYPNKPVKMIIPFAPGGASDFIGRILSVKLSEVLGQQVIVDNRTGAAGNIGMEAAAKAAPDGYTIFLGNIGTIAINPALFPNLNINPLRDFIPVTQVADVPSALVGNNDFPPNNVSQLIVYLRANPDKFNFATPGGGSANRLEMEVLMKMTGTKMTHVPYKGGGGPAAIGLIGGETQVMFNTLPSVKQFMIANKMKSYAVTGLTRQPGLPNVPTLMELGYPEFKTGSWQMIMVPVGTPVAITNKLFDSITKVLAMPDVVERIINGGANITVSKSPADAKLFVEGELKKWAVVVKDSGASPD